MLFEKAVAIRDPGFFHESATGKRFQQWPRMSREFHWNEDVQNYLQIILSAPTWPCNNFFTCVTFCTTFTRKLIWQNASKNPKKKKKIIMLHFASIFLCRSFSQIQSCGSFVTHVSLCQTFHFSPGVRYKHWDSPKDIWRKQR